MEKFDNLEQMREKIDKIDEEILKSFCDRMELSVQIAKYKKENNLPILDESREKEKLDRIAKSDDTLASFSSKLYLTLADLSREYQNKINGDNN